MVLAVDRSSRKRGLSRQINHPRVNSPRFRHNFTAPVTVQKSKFAKISRTLPRSGQIRTFVLEVLLQRLSSAIRALKRLIGFYALGFLLLICASLLSTLPSSVSHFLGETQRITADAEIVSVSEICSLLVPGTSATLDKPPRSSEIVKVPCETVAAELLKRPEGTRPAGRKQRATIVFQIRDGRTIHSTVSRSALGVDTSAGPGHKLSITYDPKNPGNRPRSAIESQGVNPLTFGSLAAFASLIIILRLTWRLGKWWLAESLATPTLASGKAGMEQLVVMMKAKVERMQPTTTATAQPQLIKRPAYVAATSATIRTTQRQPTVQRASSWFGGR
jgi:hypothetical protein